MQPLIQRVILRSKVAGAWRSPPTPSSAEVKERVQLYLYLPVIMAGYKVNSKLKLNSVALFRKRTIPTERPPPVGEVSANFCG